MQEKFVDMKLYGISIIHLVYWVGCGLDSWGIAVGFLFWVTDFSLFIFGRTHWVLMTLSLVVKTGDGKVTIHLYPVSMLRISGALSPLLYIYRYYAVFTFRRALHMSNFAQDGIQYSFIPSLVRQVHSVFQSQFSIECDLMLHNINFQYPLYFLRS
jgi:hypothetical protein